MNINISDITITSIETITAFDIVTGDFRFTLDELQNATISQSQEKTDITGKQGRKLNSLKRNKAVTISGDNGLVSAGLLELQTGSNFEEKLTTVMWTDYLTVADNKTTTSYVAVGTTGNEIDTLYIKNANGTLGKALTQAATAESADQFAYDPTTKAITFFDGAVADGTEVCVFYTRQIKANVLENLSDTYSEKCTLYVDALGEDTCANVYRVQFYIPKADFDGNFELTMGDNQTVHSFEAEALAGACGTAGTYFTYTIFGAEDDDYVNGADRMKVMSQKETVGYGTKKASDLMGADVQVAWNGTSGTVTGTFKNVTEWEELPHDPKSGHFFALRLDERYMGKPFDYLKDGVLAGHSDSAGEDEMFWVLRIDDNKKFTFKSNGEVIVDLDFTGATLSN